MFEDRIAKGVAVLNERKPGWTKYIDTRSLNLASPSQCVLGQSFGTYFVGVTMLFGGQVDVDDDARRDMAVEHGFYIPTPRDAAYGSVGWMRLTNDYHALTTEWINEIERIVNEPVGV